MVCGKGGEKMKGVISIMMLGEEWARVVEGKFEVLIESKNPRVSSRTMLLKCYNDCFYNHKDASTFDQRFQLVKEKNISATASRV